MAIVEKIKTIAIQGYQGSYHQMAAEKFYKQPINLCECPTFHSLTASVKNTAACNEAIMAIENSIAGSILTNYNLIKKAEVHIIGEVYLAIHHQLMALPGTALADIEEVHSHPMALLQCGQFLNALPQAKIIEKSDTALSAKCIAQKKLKNAAAIASKRAAELYGMEIIKSDIEDNSNNYTRFLVLSRAPKTIEGCNKASLNFELDHKPGSLHKALENIASFDINISKLQSVPVVGKQWQYTFHIDVEFSHKDHFEKMIKSIHPHCQDLKVLGMYKKEEL